MDSQETESFARRLMREVWEDFDVEAVPRFYNRDVVGHHRTQTLNFVLGNGRALEYGVGVGRRGFSWSGTKTVSMTAPANEGLAGSAAGVGAVRRHDAVTGSLAAISSMPLVEFWCDARQSGQKIHIGLP